jgi:hypothetical protein
MPKRFRFISPGARMREISKRRGKSLANQLGWPSHSHGFLGALADLANPFSPYEKPRSSMVLVREQNLRRQRESRERIEALTRTLDTK